MSSHLSGRTRTPPTDPPSASNFSNASNTETERLELIFKYLVSDAPQASFLHDEGGVYIGAPCHNPPVNHTPLHMSMGDTKQKYFAMAQNPAERNQYFADRKKVLDGADLSPEEIRQIRSRLRSVDKKMLQSTDFLITYYPTAMSEDVISSFSKPILVLVGTERPTFAEAAGVLLAHKHYCAVFSLGHPSDTRHPTVFASYGESEAWLTFGRSWLATLDNAGSRSFEMS
jgi:hypothetical protein